MGILETQSDESVGIYERGGEQILYPRVRSEGVTEREGDREENERGKGVEKSEVLRLKM